MFSDTGFARSFNLVYFQPKVIIKFCENARKLYFRPFLFVFRTISIFFKKTLPSLFFALFFRYLSVCKISEEIKDSEKKLVTDNRYTVGQTYGQVWINQISFVEGPICCFVDWLNDKSEFNLVSSIVYYRKFLSQQTFK